MKSRLNTAGHHYRPAIFSFTFKSKVELFAGPPDDWYFSNLPVALAAQLNELFADQKRGFGSLPVEVSSGGVTWQTSISTNRHSQTFMLPLKLEIRRQLELVVGDSFSLTLQIKQ